MYKNFTKDEKRYLREAQSYLFIVASQLRDNEEAKEEYKLLKNALREVETVYYQGEEKLYTDLP